MPERPELPELNDAKKLYEWAVGNLPEERSLLALKNGQKILIEGQATSPAALPTANNTSNGTH
jgi:hypothetical protein